MPKSFLLSLTAALATGLLSGCGDSSAKVSSADLKAFDSAPAEVKLAWTTALAASETNGYVLAVSTLRGLAGAGLPLEQLEAVQNAIRAVNTKLTEAVGRGDAAAVKAMEEIKAGAMRGGR